MTDKKYKRLWSNTASVAVGTLGSKLLMYLLVRFYTEVLTNEQYSIASNITETAALIIPIVSLGIGEAIFRFSLDEAYDKKGVFTSGICVSLCGFTALLILSPLLFLTSYFKDYVFIIAIYVVSSITHTVCSQFIRGLNMYRLYALQGLVNTLFTVGYNLLFLIPLKMGIYGYVLAIAAADISASLFIIIAAKLYRYIDVKRVEKSTVRSMLIFALPLIPTTISWWITNVSDRFLVTYFKGDAANGIYAASYKIPTLLTVLVGIFNNAWKYSASSEEGSEDEASFVSSIGDFFTSAMFLVSSALILFSNLIAKIMFSSDFYEARVYIPVLTAAMLFSSLASFAGTIFISHKKSSYSLVTSVIPALVNIILNIILIPLFDGRFAAMGAAIATLVSYMLMYLLKALASKKLLNYKLGLPRVLIFSVILFISAAFMSIGGAYCYAVSAVCLVLTAIIGAPSLLKGVMPILRRLRRR